MSNQDLHALLLATFADEAEEQLQAISRAMLALEATASPAARQPIVDELLREAHSLKGSAHAVELDAAEAVANELEGLFVRLQRGELETVPATLDLVHRALDELAALVADAVGRRPLDHGTLEETVRVDTRRLDALMGHVGELIGARAGLGDVLLELRAIGEDLARFEARMGGRVPRADDLRDIRRRLAVLCRVADAGDRRLGDITRELREITRSTRMLPVSTLLDTFPRMVGDLAHELGKEVRLAVEGGDTAVDRWVLEQLRGPLGHLLRNACDHGIESPEEREAAGKPRVGSVTLHALRDGVDLRLVVADDGRGIDVGAVRDAAVERGLLDRDAAQALPVRDVVELIFRPGFSTRDSVTAVSGRGVGMDVVRDHVHRVHGKIEIDTEQGRGTTFSIHVPPSVATTRCFLVEAGGETFALPIAYVEEVARLAPDGGFAVVVESAPQRMALVVDRVLGVREMPIGSLPHPLANGRLF
jgi:two-component system, chemotaxis family, sensor kinase CheA